VLNSRQEKRFFSPPKRLERLWGPLSLLLKRVPCGGGISSFEVIPPGRECVRSLPPSAELRTSGPIPPISYMCTATILFLISQTMIMTTEKHKTYIERAPFFLNILLYATNDNFRYLPMQYAGTQQLHFCINERMSYGTALSYLILSVRLHLFRCDGKSKW
jgi:hypothetical protein